MKANKKHIQDYVRSVRISRGYTQAKLAEELAVTINVVKNWETGRTIPRADKYMEITRLAARK